VDAACAPLASWSCGPGAAPPAERCTAARRLDAAIAIGPEVVDRETTGPGARTGRADAGRLVIGSPTPLRLDDDEAAGDGTAGAGGDVLAWRLTVGVATGRLDGTRRIPPAAARGATGRLDDGASTEAAAAVRWTAAGRAALAAEVRGRSGTRTDDLETVGIERIGAEDELAIGGDACATSATCSTTSGPDA
jgi:hypothetical protein